MKNKIIVKDELTQKKEWFKEAKKQTLDTLPEFANHVMNDYAHDYGSVCHAVAACAIAAAWAANDAPGACGGITGFQAGAVMWDFIKEWMYSSNKCGLKIVDYDNMLYPQYADKFQKKISKETWTSLQEQAKKSLEEDSSYAHPNVVNHWQMIADGHIPFGYVAVEE